MDLQDSVDIRRVEGLSWKQWYGDIGMMQQVFVLKTFVSMKFYGIFDF